MCEGCLQGLGKGGVVQGKLRESASYPSDIPPCLDDDDGDDEVQAIAQLEAVGEDLMRAVGVRSCSRVGDGRLAAQLPEAME